MLKRKNRTSVIHYTGKNFIKRKNLLKFRIKKKTFKNIHTFNSFLNSLAF